MLLFSSGHALSQLSWTPVHEPAFSGFINDLQFLSQNEGWAVGSNGILKYTSDGGFTWTSKTPSGHENTIFDSVHFLDEDHGWVGSRSALLLVTTDGGDTWDEVDFQNLDKLGHLEVNQFRRVQFLNADTGYMLTGRHNNQYILRSDDGGQNWVVQDSLIGGNWLDFDFYNEDRGVIVSNSATGNRYTHDGGSNWDATSDLTGVSNLTLLNAVRWMSEDHVIVMGQGNAFQSLTTTAFYSDDAGETFTASTFDPETTVDVFLALQVLDDESAIAVGHDRTTRPVVAHTNNGGVTWTTEKLDKNVQFQGLAMAGSRVFARGSSSHLLYSDDQGATFNWLEINPYSEIQNIVVTADEEIFAINGNSGVYVFNSLLGEFEYSGSALHNSPSRGNTTFFTDMNTGFMLKANRQIVKTEDGGQTWTTVLDDIPNNLNNRAGGIWFTDDDTGYAWMSKNTGTAYFIYKTTDGGDSWSEHLDFTGPANVAGVMKFFDSDTGLIAGPRRNVIWTDNAFESATTIFVDDPFPEDFSATADFRDMVIVDATTAWAVGNGFIVKTEDTGATWTLVDHGIEESDDNFFGLAADSDNIIAVTFGGYIVASTDGGENWVGDGTFFGDRILISAAAHGTNFMVGSTNGEVFVSEVADVSSELVSLERPQQISLTQNYPNPFNPSTNITFSLPATQHATLSVYNALGQQVAVLVDATLPAGSHQVAFDASRLSSGVYIYRLNTSSASLSRTMMLVK